MEQLGNKTLNPPPSYAKARETTAADQTRMNAIIENIYRNLIDEEDIIPEEATKEGVSNQTLSEQARMQSNYSHSNYEIQKIMKLMLQTSSSTQKKQLIG